MTSLQIIRGLPFPGMEFFRTENIEASLDYVPRDGDVVVASYPKTGTNWLQYIVLQIVSGGEIYPSFENLSKVSPFLEFTGTSILDNLKAPRTYKHHNPYDMVQKNANAKYIYIYRNPEDTFVSYYHFMQNFQEEPIDFDQYFESFLTGNIGYGRYFEHVKTYLAHKEDQNVLLVSYEKIHGNRKEELLRIAKYLGEEYYQCLLEGDLLEKIVERTSFEYMKSNLSVVNPMLKVEEGAAPKPLKFFRKGTVGDGKTTLSSDQIKRLKEVAKDVMKGTDVINDWYKN